MAKVAVYNQEGNQVEELNLNEAVWNIEPNEAVLFDAIIAQRASMRQGTHKVKTRTEVRGGGRKPWKQKGTGRARQGSIRSPQWRGGGVVFGPTPRSYAVKMNRKERRLALKSAFSLKFQDNTLTVVDALNFEAPKTKEMITVLEALKTSGKTLIVTGEFEENVAYSARNLQKVTTCTADSVSVLELSHYDNLIVTKAAVAKIEEVLG